MTRRQLLFVAAVMLLGGAVLLFVLDDRLERGGAFLVWAFLLTLTAALTFSLGTAGVRSGFPFARSYSKPVSTALLVSVPLAYNASVSSASYLLPAISLGALSGVWFPVLPVTAIVGATAAIVTSCSWATRTAATRVLTLTATYLGMSAVIAGLPRLGGVSDGFPLAMSADLVYLEPRGYLVVALFCAVTCAATLVRISQLRHAEATGRHRRSTSVEANLPSRPRTIVAMARALSSSLLRVRCPATSPTAATVWLELQTRGFPIIGVGAVLSVAVPVLLISAGGDSAPITTVYAFAALLVPIGTAAGAAISSRDSRGRSALSPFEATRPQGTAVAVATYVLVSAFSIVVAYLLLASGLYFAFPAYSETSAARLVMATVEMWNATASLPEILAISVIVVVFVASASAGLLILRAMLALHGKGFGMAALGVAVYALLLTAGIVSGRVGEAVIEVHFWGVALLVTGGTVAAVTLSARDRVLAWPHIASLLVVWIAFSAVYLSVIRWSDLTSAPTVFIALHASASVLPIGFFAVGTWLHFRLRHKT